MNIEELEERLLEEGCKYFFIPPFRHEGVDSAQQMGVDVLEKINGVWTVYFTERGIRQPPVFESLSEEKACEHYYKKITSSEHRHTVGVYENENMAINLQEELTRLEVYSHNSVGPPLKNGGPPLHFVSVVGKDIFKVRELYSDLPLKDYK